MTGTCSPAGQQGQPGTVTHPRELLVKSSELGWGCQEQDRCCRDSLGLSPTSGTSCSPGKGSEPGRTGPTGQQGHPRAVTHPRNLLLS